MKQKWLSVVPMSLFNFLAAMSSAAAAPALSAIQKDLDIQSNTLLIMVLSVFLLGSAVIPLFTGPLSEIFGRVVVLESTNLFYIVFNTACGAAQTQNQLIAFRFLAGLGGSGPQAVRIRCLTPMQIATIKKAACVMLTTNSIRSEVVSTVTCFELMNEEKLLQSTQLHRCLVP
jgi:MFS family permease